ncbi:MAG TPA: hypothetical protein VHO25_16915 [Polyangiaceae bacterium]|nr:hypothetical protein [Polyangiaceae bacterium]
MVQLSYVLLVAGLLGCGASEGTTCGEGTTVRDGMCVPGADFAMGNAGQGAMPEPSGSVLETPEERAAFARASCSVGEEQIVWPQSIAEVEGLVAKEWLRCEGDVVGLNETEEAAGVVFDTGGNFQYLIADGSGGLVRTTGFQQEGSWSVNDISNPDWPTKTFEIHLALVSRGVAGLDLTFSNEPEKMVMIWSGGQALYAALP